MKRVLTFILSLIICVMIISPSSANAATIKLNRSSLTLSEGSSFTLKLIGVTGKIKWTSNDKSIAIVSSKGNVSGVKSGKTTITAANSGKNYTCNVTVKEVFDAKKALGSMTHEIIDLGNGLITILENNYTFPFRVEATVVFYDNSGNMVGKSSDENYYFDKGRKCALYFHGPSDSSLDDVSYSDYKINFTVEAVYDYKSSNVNDIKIKSNFGPSNVMAEVTNDGDTSSEFTKISIVFYRNGEVVGYDYTYAEVETPGSTDYLKFSFPYDKNYDSIIPDAYDIYVNYSYN